eukprot:9485666-Pyramimonas_sp.AAC.1
MPLACAWATPPPHRPLERARPAWEGPPLEPSGMTSQSADDEDELVVPPQKQRLPPGAPRAPRGQRGGPTRP